MARKAKEIFVSDFQLGKIREKSQHLGAVRQLVASAETGMKDCLELVGDVHDVDLVSGEYAIKADGQIVLSADLQSPDDLVEDAPAKKQMLTEEGE